MTAAAPQRLVGARVSRVEDARLLSGRGRFVADVVVPGMVEAVFVRSPVAAGRLAELEVTAARGVPGVLAVLTADDLKLADRPLWRNAMGDFPFPDVQPLAHGEVRYVGDPVAIVVAENRYVAEDAAELVTAEYEPRSPAVGRERALAGAPIAHPELATNLAHHSASPDDPALEAALAGSDHVVDVTVRCQRYVPAPIETRGLVADWDPASQRMTVWTASQTPHQDRVFVARALGVGEHHVRVVSQDVGGGFGQKYYNCREEGAIVLAARRLARPVRWIEDRYENLSAGSTARDEQLRVRIGFDEEGRISAAAVEHLVDLGAYPQHTPDTGRLVVELFPAAYRIPRYGWKAASVFTNTAGRSAYRGPWLMETVARELTLDIAARDRGIDPIELRRRNMITAADIPYTSVTGRRYDRIDPLRTFEATLQAIGFEAFRERQAAARRDGRHLGLGVGTYIEPTAMGGSPFHAEAATVRLEATGTATVLSASGSSGNSVETTMAQVVADELGLALEDVRVHQGDTAVSPAGSGTGGSRTAVAAGGAAKLAAARVREKLLKLAAHRLEVAPEDLQLRDGAVSIVGVPARAVPIAQLARLAYMDSAALPEGVELWLEMTVRFDPPAETYAESTHACTCEVDTRTGQVRLLDYVVGSDCGTLINPMIVEGQLAGGVAQGIGGALLEHLRIAEDRTPVATSFKDYLLPTAEDVPDIRYVHAETPSGTPGGFKGMAEGGAIASPVAVANAVADALSPFGVRLTQLPFDPETLVMALDAAATRASR